jgi:HEAT repeat protein
MHESDLALVQVLCDEWKNTAAAPQGRLSQSKVSSGGGISDLIHQLRHKESSVRKSTAELLGRLGPSAHEAIPALLLASCDIDAAVRTSAVIALDQIDSSWPTDSSARGATRDLIEAMGRRSSEISQAASSLLSRIGRPAVPALAQALTDSVCDIQQVFVARTLGRIGPDAARAVPALALALASECAHVRQAAAEALAQIGQAAEPATPALVVALGDWHVRVRQAAARCLAHIGGAAELAIPSLIQLLADREDEVRDAAVEALAQIGSAAVPSLIEMAQARDFQRMKEWLRWRVEVSEWWTRPFGDDFLREPLKALRNAAWFFRYAGEDLVRVELVHEAVMRTLGKIGPAASAAVPVLIQATQHSSSNVRLAATRALGRIGPQANAALPTLTQRLVDRNVVVRQAVAEALAKIDSDWRSSSSVHEAFSVLVACLKQGEDEGQVAVDAFAVIGSAGVPVLVQALAADDRILRQTAATALGRIGPEAREAVPALVKALEDSHGWVREAAAEALGKIQPRFPGEPND